MDIYDAWRRSRRFSNDCLVAYVNSRRLELIKRLRTNDRVNFVYRHEFETLRHYVNNYQLVSLDLETKSHRYWLFSYDNGNIEIYDNNEFKLTSFEAFREKTLVPDCAVKNICSPKTEQSESEAHASPQLWTSIVDATVRGSQQYYYEESTESADLQDARVILPCQKQNMFSPAPNAAFVTCCKWMSEENKKIVTASLDSQLRVWDIDRSVSLLKVDCRGSWISYLASDCEYTNSSGDFGVRSSAHGLIACCSPDFSAPLRLLDRRIGAFAYLLNFPENISEGCSCVAWKPTRPHILVAGGTRGYLCCFDIRKAGSPFLFHYDPTVADSKEATYFLSPQFCAALRRSTITDADSRKDRKQPVIGPSDCETEQSYIQVLKEALTEKRRVRASAKCAATSTHKLALKMYAHQKLALPVSQNTPELSVTISVSAKRRKKSESLETALSTNGQTIQSISLEVDGNQAALLSKKKFKKPRVKLQSPTVKSLLTENLFSSSSTISEADLLSSVGQDFASTEELWTFIHQASHPKIAKAANLMSTRLSKARRTKVALSTKKISTVKSDTQSKITAPLNLTSLLPAAARICKKPSTPKTYSRSTTLNDLSSTKVSTNRWTDQPEQTFTQEFWNRALSLSDTTLSPNFLNTNKLGACSNPTTFQPAHMHPITSLTFVQNGSFLVSSTLGNTKIDFLAPNHIRLWNSDRGHLVSDAQFRHFSRDQPTLSMNLFAEHPRCSRRHSLYLQKPELVRFDNTEYFVIGTGAGFVVYEALTGECVAAYPPSRHLDKITSIINVEPFAPDYINFLTVDNTGKVVPWTASFGYYSS